VLAVTNSLVPGGGGGFGGALPEGAAEAALAFRRAFLTVATCLALAFVALVLIEEKPLQTGVAEDGK